MIFGQLYQIIDSRTQFTMLSVHKTLLTGKPLFCTLCVGGVVHLLCQTDSLHKHFVFVYSYVFVYTSAEILGKSNYVIT